MNTLPTLGLVFEWGSDGWTGGANYLKNIALAINAVPPQQRLRMVYLIRPDQVDHLAQYQSILHLADDIRLFAPGVPMNDIDVLYPCPGNSKCISFSPARAYWIPDFQHCHLPHYFSKADITWRNNQFSALAAGQDLVVLSSQSALDDFKRFFQVSCPTYVLRFTSSPEPGWLDKNPQHTVAMHGINAPYLMCCNQFWEHKDHITLFEALHLLRQRGRIVHLICTGTTDDYRNPQYFASLQKFIFDHGLTEQVKILGLIDRTHQIQILRAALAVIQPSLFEGWSTVIEDCRMLGKTVVYSNIRVHIEQAPPQGIPFTAGDANSLANVLEPILDKLIPTAGTPLEIQALQACTEKRLRFGLEIKNMVRQALKQSHPVTTVIDPPIITIMTQSSSKTDDVSANNFRTKGNQWYSPPLAGASTLAAQLFEPAIYQGTLHVLQQLKNDRYLDFVRGFISCGVKRFGSHWRYADICTVLYTLAQSLKVDHYLEIGVRQGRSMAMVVSRRPNVCVSAFDIWQQDYAGMDNPGPDFVRSQMARLGHTGSLTFVNGNSHKTLPVHFAANPSQSFDLITVDGDHTPEGAAADLRDVLPKLRIGGAIVFDDIAHPAHPELLNIWHTEISCRSEMSSFEFTEIGYGVAFAVRML